RGRRGGRRAGAARRRSPGRSPARGSGLPGDGGHGGDGAARAESGPLRRRAAAPVGRRQGASGGGGDSARRRRSAAGAEPVRAGGDLSLDQFPGVLKDPDSRVAVAIARELGHLPTPAAAAMLGRLARRDAVEARVAAAQALAARTDAPARAALAPILEAAAK